MKTVKTRFARVFLFKELNVRLSCEANRIELDDAWRRESIQNGKKRKSPKIFMVVINELHLSEQPSLQKLYFAKVKERVDFWC